MAVHKEGGLLSVVLSKANKTNYGAKCPSCNTLFIDDVKFYGPLGCPVCGLAALVRGISFEEYTKLLKE